MLPRWVLTAAAVAYLVAVLALTTGESPPGRFDIVGNIVLFVPLGALVMLRWPRLHPLWVVVLGFAASSAIEVVQLALITARDPTPNDVALNTAGTALGWVAGRTLADVVRWAQRR